jgi:hypothetical protein
MAQGILEGIGRVPHVRQTVHGPKKMGEALRLLSNDPNSIASVTGFQKSHV